MSSRYFYKSLPYKSANLPVTYGYSTLHISIRVLIHML
jgi:hypothetical protein